MSAALPASIEVLVVSDDPHLRHDVRFAAPKDMSVVLSTDARDALAVLAEDGRRPTVVVVDLQTGSAGGFALLKEMRSRPQLSQIPVLMLLERDQDGWLARQAGADAIRTKPLRSGALIEAVLELLSP